MFNFFKKKFELMDEPLDPGVGHLIKLMGEDPDRFTISRHTMDDKSTGYSYWIANGADCVRVYNPVEGERWPAFEQNAFWKALDKLKGEYSPILTEDWCNKYDFKGIHKERKIDHFREWYKDREELHKEYPSLKDVWDQYDTMYSLIKAGNPPFK